MWPFTRKPDLTNAGYQRWLRAQRPPLVMFLRLSELEQEALAGMGDDYVQGCLAAGLEAGEMLDAAQGRENGAQIPVQDVTHTMAGVVKRREAAAQAAQDTKGKGGPMLMGKEADEVAP
jgi:hypothetical protein